MKVSKVIGAISGFGTNFYLASATLAQDGSAAENWLGGVDEGVSGELQDWIPQVINLAIGLAALVCVVVLIASGYSYITASGDEQKIEKATKSLTYAIVGLVICFISVILVEFILKQVLFPGN